MDDMEMKQADMPEAQAADAIETGESVSPEQPEKEQAEDAAQERSISEPEKDDTALRAHYNGLTAQAEKMRELYPGFDLEKELRDPDFFRWTAPEGGLTVKQAYMALHGDEILAAGMQYAAERGIRKAYESVIAGRGRPREGGLSSTGGVILERDPSAMTAKERAELKRRVARGERIVF